ncbi:MAG: alanine racemase [Gammaproteobacteria bacterium]|nr:alanine racemase [Gammaproteobacteria bacterium]
MRIWAEINTAALQHNLSRVRELAPRSKVVAMVKTNAYGHGLLQCASILQNADYLGVATLDEAIAIRIHGIKTPVLLMPGFQSEKELQLIEEYNIDSVVYDPFQLALLAKASKTINVWLKLETGMHRLGFAPEVAVASIEQALGLAHVNVVALMTHFASADSPDPTKTEEQVQAFKAIVDQFDIPLSVSNSSAILRYPGLDSDFIRPGIMLYGVSPLINGQASDHNILPVMTLKASIMRLMDLKPGESVGYGSEWMAMRPSKVAVISAGYGDGYPRRPQGVMALVNGYTVPVIGRASMDYLTIDVTDVPVVELQDAVTLWGEGLAIETLVATIGASSYALLSDLSMRVPRILR